MNWKKVDLEEFQNFLERYNEVNPAPLDYQDMAWSDTGLLANWTSNQVARIQGQGVNREYWIRDFEKDIAEAEKQVQALRNMNINLLH